VAPLKRGPATPNLVISHSRHGPSAALIAPGPRMDQVASFDLFATAEVYGGPRDPAAGGGRGAWASALTIAGRASPIVLGGNGPHRPPSPFGRTNN
jgi:hypothetical protein